MFDYKFGLIWTIFSSFFFGMTFITIAKSADGDSSIFVVLLVCILFEGIGIYYLHKGRKAIKKDKETDKYGRFVYGKILKTRRTGSYVNDVPELEAIIAAYIPSEGQTRQFVETLGIGAFAYEADDYVTLKYYNDDVNIVSIINSSQIPLEILEKIDMKLNDISKPSTIVIDGIEYVEESKQ